MIHRWLWLSLALSLFFCCQPKAANGQLLADTTEHWQYGGNLNINFSQIALENWTGGGQSSIAANSLLNFSALYQAGDSEWLSELDFGYGLTRQGGGGAPFRKSDDRLQIRSRYGQKLGKNLQLSGAVDFQTAITRGFNFSEDDQGETQKTLISDFMAPGYLVSTIGFTYSPLENLRFTLSPVTGKLTFMLNEKLSDQGSFGVPAGEALRQEFGSNFHLSLSGKLWDNITYQTSGRLFSSYKSPAEIDVNWDGQLNLKVNDYMTTTVTLALIYDEDVDVERADGSVGPAVQFKEVLAVGFQFAL